MAENKKPLIIDTDPGLDDAASILWVLANGQFDIKALTITNGNVGLKECVCNGLRVLELAGRSDIPVYAGAYRPLIREPQSASWIHGKDGLGDCGLPPPKTAPAPGHAAQAIVRIVKESPEPVTILGIGPLTNLALAILLDKGFIGNVKEVLYMGGAVRVSGNRTPRASYNVYVDPEAARVVYNSGIPVVQLGLDVCNLVSQQPEDLAAIERAGTPVCKTLVKMLNFIKTASYPVYDDQGNVVKTVTAKSQVEGRGDGIGLNDLTTTGYLINPGWFKTQSATLDVETRGGLTDGETIVDYHGLWGRKPNGLFARDVDGKALVARWVKDMTACRV